MRNVLVLSIFCFFFLLGCSHVKEAIEQEITLQSAVDQIGVIVDKRNSIESRAEKSQLMKTYDESLEALNRSLEEGNIDQVLIDQLLENNDKILKESASIHKELQTIESESRKLKTKLANQLSKEDDVVVQRTLDQLIQLVSAEVAYYKTTLTFYQETAQFFKDMKAGKVPNEEKVNQLEEKLIEQEKKLDQYVDTFNQTWNQLHKNARGENLEEAE